MTNSHFCTSPNRFSDSHLSDWLTFPVSSTYILFTRCRCIRCSVAVLRNYRLQWLQRGHLEHQPWSLARTNS